MDWDDADDRMAAWLKQGDHTQRTIARVCLLFGALRGFPANACVGYAMFESKLGEHTVNDLLNDMTAGFQIRVADRNPTVLLIRPHGDSILRKLLYPSTESESDA